MVVGAVLAGRPSAALAADAELAADHATPAADPKVVIIVGPAGRATDRYRAEAREAAALARRSTSDVTALLSPEATWPAVRRALQGADIVVYMGHGNGWPSRYRDELFGATQNGFGLDPIAGPRSDDRHEYVGETRIAREVRLAPHAVVLLHHLCYASGISEPGLPEGSIDEARQRIDNFAAGFIRAGAGAVVAEAYAPPTHLLGALLRAHSAGAAAMGSSRAIGSIEAAWRGAPSANGNVTGFASSRSPGFVALMDPATPTAGFERSLVVGAGFAAAGASGVAGATGTASEPSLAHLGPSIEAPMLRGSSVAGGPARIRLRYELAAGGRLPDGMGASVRWTPLDGGVSAVVGVEAPGAAVEPVPVTVREAAIGFDVTLPSTPGRYRLEVRLHDPSGGAYDAATQSSMPALLVRVSADVDGSIVVDGPLAMVQGARFEVEAAVTNLGREAWGRPVGATRAGRATGEPSAARIVGQWLAIEDDVQRRAAAAAAWASGMLPAGHAAGSMVRVVLDGAAPVVPGTYLLVLDIVLPDGGSLVSAGREPVVLRVTVETSGEVMPRQ